MRWFYMRSQVVYRESRVVSAKVIVKFVETMTGIRAVKAFRKEVRNDDEFGGWRATTATSTCARSASSERSSRASWRCRVGHRRARAAVGRHPRRRRLDPDRHAARRGAVRAQLLLAAAGGRVLPELVPVRDGGAREGVGRARGGADGSRSGRSRSTCGRRAATCASRTSSSATATTATILPDFSLDIPAGADDRAGRHDRRRQVDARQARVAVLRPDARPVTLDGVDLRSLHPKDLRRAIVMVTQEAYLFSGTVADNIALGKPDATLDEIQRGGARGGGGRLHRAPARRLRHRRQQARRPRLGGSAPADLVRAGLPREPGGADPRRGDGVARHPERAA